MSKRGIFTFIQNGAESNFFVNHDENFDPKQLIEKAIEIANNDNILIAEAFEKMHGGKSDMDLNSVFEGKTAINVTNVTYNADEETLRVTPGMLGKPIKVDTDNQIAKEPSTLAELINCNLENVHLCHVDEDIELATVVELNGNTLTEKGKADWSDVLNAKVQRIYEGAYGTQIELSDVNPERLSDFSYMLAGYCSAEKYDEWVADEGGQTQDQDMNM